MTRGSIGGGTIAALVCGAISFAGAAGVASAKIQTQQTPGGALRILADSKPTKRVFPLADTTVNAHITGHVAQVAVRQKFNNPFTKALEAIYVFPLPQNAAVASMRITVGKRTITTVIKSRIDARKIYDKAKRDGKLVARLTQERANIFTQSVANIAPGKSVLVELVYDVPLRQTNDQYEFVYPMVVGPRYIPGTPTGKPTKGGGRAPDTTKVPDASRITPPILKPGARSGHNVSVNVTIDPGAAMRPPTSPTHKIIVAKAKHAKRPHAVVVSLAKADQIPNKDLVVRYRLVSTATSVAVVAHRGKQGGFFALTLRPPAKVKASAIAAKELVFVVDTSGSMAGESIAMIKRAMRYALRNLRSQDAFQIIHLSSGKRALGDKPLVATAANVRRALSYINGMTAAGSSDLLTGMRASLAGAKGGKRLRIVTFLTDGYVGNDAEVLAAVTKLIGPRTRLFPIGVGSSVNRSLLERMASLGRGVAHYMLLRENPEKQIKAFYKRIHAPVLTNIAIDWKGLDVKDLAPSPIPDVFAGRPLQLRGRYDRAGEATITVRAKYAGKDVSFPVVVSLPKAEDNHATLARLWARAKVRRLMAFSYGKRTPATIDAIRKLGMKFGLMTKYTSLVGEDKQVVNPGGKVRTYYVPVEMPQGVSYGGVLREGSKGTVSGAIKNEPMPADGGSGGDVDEAPALKRTSGYASGSLEVSALARQSGRWHFELGLSTGVVGREEVGNALQTQLNVHVARVLVPRVRLGVDVMMYLPELDTDGGGSAVVVRSGYLGLLRGRLELGGGLGLAFPFDDKVGFAFLATAVYRLPTLGPISPALQLRYEGNHVPISGQDTRSFTIGAGFGF